jgi:hypothetical protein
VVGAAAVEAVAAAAAGDVAAGGRRDFLNFSHHAEVSLGGLRSCFVGRVSMVLAHIRSLHSRGTPATSRYSSQSFAPHPA